MAVGTCLGIGFASGLLLIYLRSAFTHRAGKSLPISIGFASQGDCAKSIVDEVRRARHWVVAPAQSFSVPAIAAALNRLIERGVAVHLLLTRGEERPADARPSTDEGRSLKSLINAHYGAVDKKLLIIVDQHTVIAGRFDFNSGSSNDGSLWIIKGCHDLVEAYLRSMSLTSGGPELAPGVIGASPGDVRVPKRPIRRDTAA